MSGRLVLIATPIGNLGDLSPRAVEELARAELLLCEDTRRTRALLSAAEVPAGRRLESLHEHNEQAKVPAVIRRLLEGAEVALVSDAGMPGISDPGERLVAAAVAAGVEVSVVPGPSAVLAALVVSGLPTGRFVMEGFLPRKGAERRARLEALAIEERSIVLFESPHRLAASLVELTELLGAARPVVVARELTKLHEELWRGSLAEAAAHFAETETRGELVLVLGGAAPAVVEAPSEELVLAAIAEAQGRGLSTRDAAAEIAGSFGLSRRQVYELAIRGPGPEA
jgi:16S rRNA (cytidine1402-2'-O)-methyltransferase